MFWDASSARIEMSIKASWFVSITLLLLSLSFYMSLLELRGPQPLDCTTTKVSHVNKDLVEQTHNKLRYSIKYTYSLTIGNLFMNSFLMKI